MDSEKGRVKERSGVEGEGEGESGLGRKASKCRQQRWIKVIAEFHNDNTQHSVS